jgi:hypothetical protein
MASFTDNVPQFNPYVPQQPVEDMVKVGMMKQQQYDTNLQKIQQTMSHIAGLPIARDVDKQYLQNKMSEMNNQLQTYASGDLSSNRLTASIRGMIGGIANDEIVQNAVMSTQRYKEQLDFIKKEREEGNLSPENMFDFQKQASTWLNGTEAGESFNGQYQKYFDVLEYTREVFDDIKPDGKTFDEVFAIDENGNPKLNPAMRRLQQEGLLPPKVKAVVDQIFSEAKVQNQLAITGKYRYQGATSEQLKQKIMLQKDSTLEYLNAEKERLLADKTLGKDVQEELDSLESAIENTNDSFDDYLEMADENPEYLRGHIYTEETRHRYNQMFTNVTTSETWHVNPQWKGAFDIQKEANANARHKDKLDWDKESFALKLAHDEKIAMAKIKAEQEGSGIVSTPMPGQQPSSFDKSAYHDYRVTDVSQRFNDSSNRMIWEYNLRHDPTSYNALREGMKENSNQAEVIDKIIVGQAVKEYAKNNPNIDLESLSEEEIENVVAKYKTDKLKVIKEQINSGIIGDNGDWARHRHVEREMKIISDLDKKIDSYFNDAIKDMDLSGIDLGQLEIEKRDGTTTQLTSEDILDLALSEAFDRVYLFKDDEKREKQRIGKQATERLMRKYSPEMVAILQGKRTNERQGSGPLLYQYIKDEVNRVKAHLKESPAFVDAIQEKEQLIDNYYMIDPNLNYTIFDGKAETDRRILNQVKLLVSTYKGIHGDPQNASDTFEEFANEVKDDSKADDLNINAHVVMGEDGKPVAHLVTGKGNTMIVPVKDLERFNINIGKDLGTSESKKIMEYLSTNPTTSLTSPYEPSTYINGDYIYDNNDFQHLRGYRDFDVKVNFVRDLDGYKPVIYVGFKNEETNAMHHMIFDKPGYSDMESVLLNLQTFLTPASIKAQLLIMNKK